MLTGGSSLGRAFPIRVVGLAMQLMRLPQASESLCVPLWYGACVEDGTDVASARSFETSFESALPRCMQRSCPPFDRREPMKSPQLLRLSKLLPLIARAGGITVADAADDLRCTIRTIRRDLAVLRDAGFPLYMDRGGGRPFRWRVAHEGLKLAEAVRAADFSALVTSDGQSLSYDAGLLLDRMREAAGFDVFSGQQLSLWPEPTRGENFQSRRTRPSSRRARPRRPLAGWSLGRPGMAHPVAEIIRNASLENWCYRPFCTTCGCMQFREAIRDLPKEVVDDFLRLPLDPELERLPNFAEFWHLIVFHPLPRTEAEELEARRRRKLARAELEMREIQARAGARDRRIARLAEKRRAAAERHAERMAESARRKHVFERIAALPLGERIRALIGEPQFPPGFFSINPDGIDEEVLAGMDSGTRAAIAERISGMRKKSWRELRGRLQRMRPSE